MNFDTIAENAGKIDACISIKKDGLDRLIYEIADKCLNANVRKILQDEEAAFKKNVSTEMRHTGTSIAVQCCADVADFSSSLLSSNVPNRLKIALFGRFNIFGFMFDRNRESYAACHEILWAFLESVEKYKNSLSLEDLNIWNDWTYGGTDQIPFFRGYLRGIKAR